ncbi:MAG TPA: alpha/beta hydrolase [Cyclobacteriaceae bacterium]
MNTIFYTDEGEGLPIIFIHGICETHELWDGFTSFFSKNFRVITIDLPGFGRSPLPAEEFTIDSIGLSVIKWLTTLSISKAIFVGHSLGGYVALSIANQNPGLVAGLCLFHSTAFADTKEKKNSRDKVNDFVRKHGVVPYIKTYVPGLFAQKDNPSIAKIYEMALKTDPKALILYANALKERSERTIVLKKSTYPVLIIAGLKDTLISLKDLEEQVTLPSSAAYILLEHSAHLGMIEETEVSGDALLKFADKCNSTI